jgi:adenosylcobinamide-phosphate synthase
MVYSGFINETVFISPLIVGFILDSLLGDPLWLPHPIRLFGTLISFLERKYNQGNNRKMKGVLTVIFLIIVVYVLFSLADKFLFNYPLAHYAFVSVMIFYGIAGRNLIAEALKVEKRLSKNGIEAGREQLSNIVGRDTSQLSENNIRIAVLETLSENLSDGVIAPLFYFAIGGVPLMFVYKMINTLDSMIGYKNEKYDDFGWFAARVDDVFNYIPARITSFLMVALTFSWRGLKYIFLYGNKHASPNAGYPEAALAGILNCRFGGPNYYYGRLVNKPFIGTNDRIVNSNDILKSSLINVATTIVYIFLALLLKH